MISTARAGHVPSIETRDNRKGKCLVNTGRNFSTECFQVGFDRCHNIRMSIILKGNNFVGSGVVMGSGVTENIRAPSRILQRVRTWCQSDFAPPRIQDPRIAHHNFGS
ncbi:hypothetical protein TNCV_3474611 [Trichonephila clavipes]|nr:hypothetical protein TNCV_3474611 [Trichonephila clavipes]